MIKENKSIREHCLQSNDTEALRLINLAFMKAANKILT